MGLSAAFEVHRYPPSMFDEPQNEVAIPGSRRNLSSDRAEPAIGRAFARAVGANPPDALR